MSSHHRPRRSISSLRLPSRHSEGYDRPRADVPTHARAASCASASPALPVHSPVPPPVTIYHPDADAKLEPLPEPQPSALETQPPAPAPLLDWYAALVTCAALLLALRKCPFTHHSAHSADWLAAILAGLALFWGERLRHRLPPGLFGVLERDAVADLRDFLYTLAWVYDRLAEVHAGVHAAVRYPDALLARAGEPSCPGAFAADPAPPPAPTTAEQRARAPSSADAASDATQSAEGESVPCEPALALTPPTPSGTPRPRTHPGAAHGDATAGAPAPECTASPAFSPGLVASPDPTLSPTSTATSPTLTSSPALTTSSPKPKPQDAPWEPTAPAPRRSMESIAYSSASSTSLGSPFSPFDSTLDAALDSAGHDGRGGLYSRLRGGAHGSDEDGDDGHGGGGGGGEGGEEGGGGGKEHRWRRRVLARLSSIRGARSRSRSVRRQFTDDFEP
ncbi:hypothetical protein PsYK624_063310 [Phanerochaete sordida]|uniref:Uncharacterized protein n=1 Tax=Phanerochaete sordida TaxID=48140 RepID=A0A9P3LCG0_9APHY|nr:hypothetical protein PsYK624_063310 [Phanerochaete sordida]